MTAIAVPLIVPFAVQQKYRRKGRLEGCLWTISGKSEGVFFVWLRAKNKSLHVGGIAVLTSSCDAYGLAEAAAISAMESQQAMAMQRPLR
jgi:hypothetical protein